MRDFQIVSFISNQIKFNFEQPSDSLNIAEILCYKNDYHFNKTQPYTNSKKILEGSCGGVQFARGDIVNIVFNSLSSQQSFKFKVFESPVLDCNSFKIKVSLEGNAKITWAKHTGDFESFKLTIKTSGLSCITKKFNKRTTEFNYLLEDGKR